MTPLNVALFGALFVASGAAVPPVYAWIERRVPRGAGALPSAGILVAALAGLLVSAGAWYYVLATAAAGTAPAPAIGTWRSASAPAGSHGQHAAARRGPGSQTSCHANVLGKSALKK